MTIRFLNPFLLMVAMLLNACISLYPPAPAERPVSENSAVRSLLASARNDIAQGKPDTAAATLERALRIEPRNPFLWQELAKVQLQQGQYQQAEGLAARSNGWAGEDKLLRAENWRLIGESRLKRGDYAGAQAAFDKAARIAAN